MYRKMYKMHSFSFITLYFLKEIHYFLLLLFSITSYLFYTISLKRKDPDAGKDWRQEKGMTEDETIGWHHQLIGHEFEQAPEVGEGQGSLACCSPWGCQQSDTTE